jgi:hypothetical protein
MPSNEPTIVVHREGDTSKPDPFTICFVANPVIEALLSGSFRKDPMIDDQSGFDDCVAYAIGNLYGDHPGQGEGLLAPQDIADAVRVTSVFVRDLPPTNANALVAEDDPRSSTQVIARRTAARSFLSRFSLDADVVFAVTASTTHDWSTAWPATDDDGRSGVDFELDGVEMTHRFFTIVPGTIALHVTERDITPLHEFQHALGSYSNGQIEDLYLNSGAAVNRKQGRPIPDEYAVYNGVSHASDKVRNGIGYPPNGTAYHCELHFPSAPAVMDDYFKAPAALGTLACENDTITRRFLQDRIRAKLGR